jgi:hypothetical protein
VARIDSRLVLEPLVSTPSAAVDLIAVLGASTGASSGIQLLSRSGAVLGFDSNRWRTLAPSTTWDTPIDTSVLELDLGRVIRWEGGEMRVTHATGEFLRFQGDALAGVERVDDPALVITDVATSTRYGTIAMATTGPIGRTQARLTVALGFAEATRRWTPLQTTEAAAFANTVQPIGAGFIYGGDGGAVGVYLPDRNWFCTPLQLSLSTATRMIPIGPRWLVAGRPRLRSGALILEWVDLH